MYCFLVAGGALASFLLGTASAQLTTSFVPAGSTVPPYATPVANSTVPARSVIQTASASPSANIGLGFFSLARGVVKQGYRDVKTEYGCYVSFGGQDVLGCKPANVFINNGYCTDQTGRYSTAVSGPGCDGGTLTVEFSGTSTGPTYIHYTSADDNYTGCTIPSGKSEGATCINNQQGAAVFGSEQYIGSWCVADITQYQKADANKPNTESAGQYGFYVEVYDSATNGTGPNGRNLLAASPQGQMYNIQHGQQLTNPFGGKGGKTSILPGTFSISPGNVDSDPYTITYQNPYTGGDLTPAGTETFNAYSTANQCGLANVFPNGGHGNTWGYDSGNRKNTCGFHC